MKTVAEIKKAILRQKWTIASTPGHLMTHHPWMAGFMRMRKYYRHYPSEMWLLNKDTLCFQLFDERENYENLAQLYAAPKKVRQIRARWRSARAKFFNISERRAENLAALSDAQLLQEFSAFLNEFIEIWAPPLAVDNMAVFTEGELLSEFTDALPETERGGAHEYFAAVSQPSAASFVTRERLSLLSLALLRKGGDAAFETALAKHQRDFYWTANSYKEIKELSRAHFLKNAEEESVRTKSELAAEIKELNDLPVRAGELREKILKRFSVPRALREKLLLTSCIGEWLDERKEFNLRGNHFLMRFLQEIGKRHAYSLEEMYYFTPSEIRALVQKGAGVPKKELSARRRGLVYILAQPEEATLFSGKDAEQIISFFEEQTKVRHGRESVQGVVACRGAGGVIQGRVRVVLDPEGVEFKTGEILVSTMTRAEYVPLMKKAAVIVTDEGGITCHAAVISREMGIPCIIGAKAATKVLKDGDLVEVKVDTGEVRVLERALPPPSSLRNRAGARARP